MFLVACCNQISLAQAGPTGLGKTFLTQSEKMKFLKCQKQFILFELEHSLMKPQKTVGIVGMGSRPRIMTRIKISLE